MYYPLGQRPDLRQQLRMLDLDRLRVGKVLEVMDSLALDAGYHYMRDFDISNERRKMYLTTVAMAGLNIQTPSSANKDFGLTVYPVGSTISTLTIRADLLQKQEDRDGQPHFKPVMSTSFLLAARDGTTHKKF